MNFIGAIAAAWGLGFIYFIAAIPTSVALGLPVALAAFVAWTGYAAGGLAVVLAGEPVRDWLMKKLKVSATPDRSKFIYRVWDRYGLWAMALLAPVTIGPQASALLGLAFGVPPRRLAAAIAIGVIPWCVLFAILTALGVQIVQE